MSSSLSDSIDDLVCRDVTKLYRENLVARKNIPSITEHFFSRSERPDLFFGMDRLWIVDRVLEQQSVGQFLEAAMGRRPLPTGEMIGQALDPDEWVLVTRAYSSWAPPPFNTEQMVPIHRVMELIGSVAEPRRMQLVSKELHAMKSRLWEGIMPLSTRRWGQKQMYEPSNFSAACRILSMTVNVFLYLNLDVVKAALRETFNLIDSIWVNFENALNIKRAIEKKPSVEVSKKWHEFIRAKYAVMVNRTHDWVMNHVAQIKSRVLDQLEAHRTSRSSLGTSPDDEERRLYDMWQDISEIASEADCAILMPMDGYNGSEDGLVYSEYDFRNQPLRVNPDINQRYLDYHNRRGHWTLTIMAHKSTVGLGSPTGSEPGNDPVEALQRQDAGQKFARAELRGVPVRYEKEPWVVMIKKEEEWGFVAYRTYHSCSDADWDEYRAKFDADHANWGSELPGVETLRERSKIHWVDAKDFGIHHGDIETLKRSFTESANFPSGLATDVFLVADECSVLSYLSSQPEFFPHGDTGGFVLAIDVGFDPSTGIDRPEESPGYGGSLKVLGSLLWDDFSALIASHTEHLATLWPLAMNHPSRVYVGPFVKVGKSARTT